MALDIEGFTRWLEGKSSEVRGAGIEPLSLQTTIAALSQRGFLTARREVRQLLDGTDE